MWRSWPATRRIWRRRRESWRPRRTGASFPLQPMSPATSRWAAWSPRRHSSWVVCTSRSTADPRRGGTANATSPNETVVDDDFVEDFKVMYVGALRCALPVIPFTKYVDAAPILD